MALVCAGCALVGKVAYEFRMPELAIVAAGCTRTGDSSAHATQGREVGLALAARMHGHTSGGSPVLETPRHGSVAPGAWRVALLSLAIFSAQNLPAGTIPNPPFSAIPLRVRR